MPGERFMQYDRANAIPKEVEATQSGGSAQADKIPSLDSDGRLDSTMMPAGFGLDTLVIEATEALSAGDAVNIYPTGGNLRCRKADASALATEAHGFVKSAVNSGDDATIFLRGLNSDVSGLNIGHDAFLSETAGDVTNTAPTTSGAIVQKLGYSISATSMEFVPEQPIQLA